MSIAETKVRQYLAEAHAHEVGLVRVLQSQVAVAPRGKLRTGLERHLGQTRDHASRLRTRLDELGERSSVLEATTGAAVGAVQSVLAQGLALSKTPIDLVRGSGGHEKVLKNAKDACATEALEIATYDAIEQVAKSAGDEQTAKLAVSIRADEERMLELLRGEIPALAAAVAGDKDFKVTETGVADAARTATHEAARSAGIEEPVRGYDDMTVAEVKAHVADHPDRADEIKRYERAHAGRKGVLESVAS